MIGATALKKKPGPKRRGGKPDPEYLAMLEKVSSWPGASDRNDPTTSVYVMTADNVATKVGRSKRPSGRLKNMQSGQHQDIFMFWAIRLDHGNAVAIEGAAHRKLRKVCHLRGEWYAIDPLTAVAVIQKEIAARGFKTYPDIECGFGRGL